MANGWLHTQPQFCTSNVFQINPASAAFALNPSVAGYYKSAQLPSFHPNCETLAIPTCPNNYNQKQSALASNIGSYFCQFCIRMYPKRISFSLHSRKLLLGQVFRRHAMPAMQPRLQIHR